MFRSVPLQSAGNDAALDTLSGGVVSFFGRVPSQPSRPLSSIYTGMEKFASDAYTRQARPYLGGSATLGLKLYSYLPTHSPIFIYAKL